MADDKRDTPPSWTAGFPAAEANPVFRAMVRRTHQPLLVLSENMTVLFANPAFYDQLTATDQAGAILSGKPPAGEATIRSRDEA